MSAGPLSEYAGKIGLNRPIPKWMRWEGLPVVSFIFVTTLAQLIGSRDYPLAAKRVRGRKSRRTSHSLIRS